MRILILGASGLVGHNLFERARSLGHEAVGTYHSCLLPDLVYLEVEDTASVVQLLKEVKPDAIFYCAGWSWVDGCEDDPLKAFHENCETPEKIAGIAEGMGCHFTYFSTSYVFDGVHGPYIESAAPCPISVYGHSKEKGERAVLEATHGHALIARTMGVYGLESQRKNFVYQVRAALAAKKRLRVPNDQFGNVTFAPDLAQMALELAMQRRSGIWNLAGPDPTVRRSDFARQIAETYGLPIDLVQAVETASLGQRAHRPRQGGLYIRKALQAVSLVPRSWVKIE